MEVSLRIKLTHWTLCLWFIYVWEFPWYCVIFHFPSCKLFGTCRNKYPNKWMSVAIFVHSNDQINCKYSKLFPMQYIYLTFWFSKQFLTIDWIYTIYFMIEIDIIDHYYIIGKLLGLAFGFYFWTVVYSVYRDIRNHRNSIHDLLE